MNNNDSTTNRFDLKANTWDSKTRRVIAANAVAQSMIDALNIKQSHHVMEFGAGTGLVTMHFQPLVKKITAIDSSTAMMNVLREKIIQQHIDNIELKCVDIEHSTLADSEYDIIISSMTLHHLNDIEHVLNQFYQSLKPPAQIAIVDLDKEPGDFHSDNSGVKHFGFERVELNHLAQRIGFHSIQFSTPHIIKKETNEGIEKEFSLFMMAGKKT